MLKKKMNNTGNVLDCKCKHTVQQNVYLCNCVFYDVIGKWKICFFLLSFVTLYTTRT